MPNEKVLVIDDDPDVLQLAKECLAGAGYEVLTVVDSSAAGQIARDERPDAIIVEVDMPGTDGRAICKAVKSEGNLKHIPVIFIHEKPTLDDKLAGFGLGAQDYIAKPFETEELVARVDAAVRVKVAMDRLRQRNAKLESLAKHVQTAVQHYEQPRLQPGATSDTDASGKTAARLTRRELEILQLLAQGLSNDVISRQLYISPTTTRNHIQNILSKLGVHSKLEAVAYAVRSGYVDFVG
ncbi:response regulator PleD [bacterium BMS3Abin01]|nr:response regulator PleD [bacterium BMS3Abin01]HDY69800.1 response regulator transcription factor [Actinomycetota bacterium]